MGFTELLKVKQVTDRFRLTGNMMRGFGGIGPREYNVAGGVVALGRR